MQILHMHGKRNEEGGRGEGRDDDDGTNERGGEGREKGLRSGERRMGCLEVLVVGVESYDHHDVLQDFEFKEKLKEWS